MLQRRGTTTDRLAHIIQVLQLGRKTGMLSVERGEGSTREEGTITFVQGQITQACVGQQSGPAALARLNSWGACRFTFVVEQTERTTGPLLQTETPPPTYERIQAPTKRGPAERDLSGDTDNSLPRLSRIQPIDEALYILDQTRLSRMHRHLLLLIDGQRTPKELERLLGRTQYEIQQLLHDLIVLGLIRFS